MECGREGDVSGGDVDSARGALLAPAHSLMRMLYCCAVFSQYNRPQDIDFSLSSVVVDKAPRPDSRIVDVTIRLSGQPFGEVALRNVAFLIDGKWFLGTPEPLVR